jgi:hypothetical protein
VCAPFSFLYANIRRSQEPELHARRDAYVEPKLDTTTPKRFQYFQSDEEEISYLQRTGHSADRRRSIINPPLERFQTYPANSTEASIVGPVRNPIYPATAAFEALSENVSRTLFVLALCFVHASFRLVD